MQRKATVKRKTRETDISVEMNLDGRGDTDIKTPVPFFTHMLSSLSKHALFDLKIRAKGDIEVDLHHTVEDVGLILGEAFKEAVGDKRGIVRCGSSSVPMMDSLATAVVDISGRPYFKFNSTKDSFAVTGIFSKGPESMKEAFNMDLLQEFMKAFSNSAGIDLHITVPYGRDVHHAIESIFKALGRALSAAAAKDPRIKGVMSTKGRL